MMNLQFALIVASIASICSRSSYMYMYYGKCMTQEESGRP